MMWYEPARRGGGVLQVMIVAVLLFCPLVSGASLTVQHGRLRFEHLTMADGLSDNGTRCVLQDHRGFIWVGTPNGLNRYDGLRFVTYHPDAQDPFSLSGSFVMVLFEDSRKNLWIGTNNNGLNRYDATQDRFERFTHDDSDPTTISHDGITSIAEDLAGNIWIGTWGGGLNRLDPQTGRIVRYRHDDNNPHSLSHDRVWSVYRDRSGMLWIGTGGGGLNKFDPTTNRFTHFRHDPTDPHSLSADLVRPIFEDHQGVLWAGTETAGLNRFDGHHRFTRFQNAANDPDSIAGNDITTVFEDNAHTLWIATSGAGVDRFNRATEQFIHSRYDEFDGQSLLHNEIRDIHQDRQGIIWMATVAGVSKLDPARQRFIHRRQEPGNPRSLASNDITTIANTPEDQLLIGHQKGLDQLNQGGLVVPFDHPAARTRGWAQELVNIRSIAHDSQQNLWLGTWGGGLLRIDRQTGSITRFRHDPTRPDSLSNDIVVSVFIDAGGGVWVGTWGGGLNRLNEDQQTFTHYRHDPKQESSICSDNLFAMIARRQGGLWIATLEGLDQLDPQTGEFTHFKADPLNARALHSKQIISLYETEQNILWVGTMDMGLSRFDPVDGGFTHFNQKDGLSGDFVTGLTMDDQEMLWIVTRNGLSRMNTRTHTFNRYNASHGLVNGAFNVNSVVRDPNGVIHIGSKQGVLSFDPATLKDNPHIPPVVLTDFKLFNKSVPIGRLDDGRTLLPVAITDAQQITLAYSDYVMSFEYAALDFVSPQQNQYAYIMHGLESRWNEVGSRSFATYTNLSPGVYTFTVKASNNDGLWNETGTSLKIVVTPPFWQTWWFRLLIGSLIVSSAVLVHKVRVYRIKQRNKELEQKVAERTLVLREQKKQLQSTLTELNETKDELVENAHKAGMADIASAVLHNVGNSLNSANTSVSLIQDQLKKSKLARLGQFGELIDRYLQTDETGQKALKFYGMLKEVLHKEKATIAENADRLQKVIDEIHHTVTAQQEYAKGQVRYDTAPLEEIVESTLAFQLGAVPEAPLTIEKNFDSIPPVRVQKAKLAYVLTNIYKNAIEALADTPPEERRIKVDISKKERQAVISITDNGCGIAPDQLTQIFAYNYTTKANRRGFGLHSCSNYMTEMRGEMRAESDGPNRGARFVISIPLSEDETTTEDPDQSTVIN